MKYIPFLFIFLGIYLALDSILMFLSSIGISNLNFSGFYFDPIPLNWDFFYKFEKISLIITATGKLVMAIILFFTAYIMKIHHSLADHGNVDETIVTELPY